jgi:hypothetical protein
MSQQRNSLQRSSTLAEAEDLHRRIVSQERLTRDATARWASVLSYELDLERRQYRV